MSETILCPDCGAPMILRVTKKHSYPNGGDRKFYGCSRWPKCETCHGAHPDGSPIGYPGDKPTREARIEAHAAFDPLRVSRRWQKRGAYVWLSRKLSISFDECHIGMFDVAMCKRVIQVCAAAAERDRKGKSS